MSSDPKFIPLLLGLGIRNVSVTPSSVPEVKDVVRNFSIDDAEQIAKHALSLDVARDVENFLRNELNRLCPDRLSDAPQSQLQPALSDNEHSESTSLR